jgi:zinc carboxypeptidase
MRLAATATAAALALTAPMLVGVTSAGTASAPGGRAPCDPFVEPVYAGNVPGPADVIGMEFGEQEVRNNQSARYIRAVDEASRRVRSGVLAISGQGRTVPFAIVGAPRDVRAAQRAASILRNPQTTPQRAAQVAARAPAIAWDAGNVHGNEESGADAALRLLRDLSDRSDCAARRIRSNVVTVIVPIQNPDGRWLDYRRNSYGFDMNRDWFARTQPETDGKVELLRRYPAVLFIDDHEMGSDGFFFPPNADPVHHEVANRSIRWVNDLYGRSMAREFDERGIPYFNYDIYDMFTWGTATACP